MEQNTLVENLANDIAIAANYKLAALSVSMEKTAGAMDGLKSLGSAFKGFDPKTMLGYGLGGAAKGTLYGGGLGAAAGSLGGAIKGYRGASGSLGDKLKAGLRGGAKGGVKGGLIGAGAGAGAGALGGVGTAAYNAKSLPGLINKAQGEIDNIVGAHGGWDALPQEVLETVNGLNDKVTQYTNTLNGLKSQGLSKAFEQYSGIPASQLGQKATELYGDLKGRAVNAYGDLKGLLAKMQPQGNI